MLNILNAHTQRKVLTVLNLGLTLEGTLTQLETKGEGDMKREIDLKQYDKALIGFRGCIKEHVYDLYAYVALRLDILNDAIDDDELEEIADDQEDLEGDVDE